MSTIWTNFLGPNCSKAALLSHWHNHIVYWVPIQILLLLVTYSFQWCDLERRLRKGIAPSLNPGQTRNFFLFQQSLFRCLFIIIAGRNNSRSKKLKNRDAFMMAPQIMNNFFSLIIIRILLIFIEAGQRCLIRNSFDHKHQSYWYHWKTDVVLSYVIIHMLYSIAML